MSKDRRRNVEGSAFTLVELLVVIGIIALLISMLLPVLRKVREAGLNVKCASNLRQCGIALQLYCNDNHGVLPYRPKPLYSAATIVFCYNGNFQFSTPPNNLICGWGISQPSSVTSSVPRLAGSMVQYLKTMNVWGCPNVAAPAPDDVVANKYDPWTLQDLRSNYQMFWWSTDPGFKWCINAGNYGPAPSFGLSISQFPSRLDRVRTVADASEFPLMQDMTLWDGTARRGLTNHPTQGGGRVSTASQPNAAATATSSTNQSDQTFLIGGSLLKNLCQGANILFCDGHVDWTPSAYMISAGWEKNNDTSANVYTYFKKKV